MSTILKWAGNKTAIMSELKKHLPAGPRLVEPFAGSCAVMMETDYPSYLVADINPDLINLYKKVAADCEAFISRARALFEEANRELAYYNIRQEFNYSTEITDFMKAVYFLYLNRHGYRGLCRYNKSGISTFHTVIIKIRISLKKKFAHLQRKPSKQRLSAPALMKRWRCCRWGMWCIAIRLMTVRFPAITLTASLKMTSITWHLFLNIDHQKVIQSLFLTVTHP
ncbi:DNA adenine methylase [Klebsiella pneumoniae]|nr:DNA adenine methylase [Klebsiella pneumoniae]